WAPPAGTIGAEGDKRCSIPSSSMGLALPARWSLETGLEKTWRASVAIQRRPTTRRPVPAL
ncbi:MAG: hypothetical protein ACXWKY_06890, partial [Caulobacteraceae bacterium]